MNSIKIFVVGTLALAMFVANAAPAAAQLEASQEFCQVTDGIHNTVDEKIEAVATKIEERWNNYQSATTEKRAGYWGRAAELEGEWVGHRDDIIDHLTSPELGITDAQADVIDAFKGATDAALETRRVAVDAATEVFWADMDVETARIREDALAAIHTYGDSVKASLEAARERCEAGEAAAENKPALQADLQAAREVFDADRAALAVRDGITAIVDVRAAATKGATEDFRATMREEGNVLRAAF